MEPRFAPLVGLDLSKRLCCGFELAQIKNNDKSVQINLDPLQAKHGALVGLDLSKRPCCCFELAQIKNNDKSGIYRRTASRRRMI